MADDENPEAPEPRGRKAGPVELVIMAGVGVITAAGILAMRREARMAAERQELAREAYAELARSFQPLAERMERDYVSSRPGERVKAAAGRPAAPAADGVAPVGAPAADEAPAG